MAAAVVAHGVALVLRHLVELRQELLDRQVPERVALEGVVDVRYVGSVVLVMMDLHRARIDVRLERIKGVGQVGERVRHLFSLKIAFHAQ